MRKLTENQITFILKNFFCIDDTQNSIYTRIARKLLETGSCIVAGEIKLWKGGVGNFISTEPAEGSVDCTLYLFDLKALLNSEWYKQQASLHLNMLETKMMGIQKEYDEIMMLSNTSLS